MERPEFISGPKALPTVTIGGKPYFRDDRLEEFRGVATLHRIKFEELGAYATEEEVRAIFGTTAGPTRGEVTMVKRLISDELKADVEYESLIATTTDPSLKDLLERIREDEKKHAQMLSAWLKD